MIIAYLFPHVNRKLLHCHNLRTMRRASHSAARSGAGSNRRAVFFSHLRMGMFCGHAFSHFAQPLQIWGLVWCFDIAAMPVIYFSIPVK